VTIILTWFYVIIRSGLIVERFIGGQWRSCWYSLFIQYLTMMCQLIFDGDDPLFNDPDGRWRPIRLLLSKLPHSHCWTGDTISILFVHCSAPPEFDGNGDTVSILLVFHCGKAILILWYSRLSLLLPVVTFPMLIFIISVFDIDHSLFRTIRYSYAWLKNSVVCWRELFWRPLLFLMTSLLSKVTDSGGRAARWRLLMTIPVFGRPVRYSHYSEEKASSDCWKLFSHWYRH